MRCAILSISKNAFLNYIVKPAIPRLKQGRFISTSQKNSDTVVAESSVINEPKTIETNVGKGKRNWQSYGFDVVNEVDDLNKMHGLAFFSITIAFCGIIFICLYYPDMNNYDWVRREGHLELHRRESLGLPLIDPNFVDPATIHLPSDDELGDTDIII